MTQTLKQQTDGKSIGQVLAENLKTLMARHEGMTVASLSRESGVSRGQISNILTQSSATTTDTLEKLAEVLETDPSSLLSADKKTHYFFGVEKEIEELIEDKYPNYREDVLKLARDLIADSFWQTDDEGKLALLRVAVSMLGWSPELGGYKMPRDWRDLADHVAQDWGWYDEQHADAIRAAETIPGL